MAVTSEYSEEKLKDFEMCSFPQSHKEAASSNETGPYDSYHEVKRMTVFIHSVFIWLIIHLMNVIY